MGVLVDTSVFIALERSGTERLEASLGDEVIWISAISAAELLHGVHRANSVERRGRRERFVESILSAIPVLPFDLEVARIHARLWADAVASGQAQGAHDLQIAATALRHDLTLATHNVRHFRTISGLRLLALT